MSTTHHALIPNTESYAFVVDTNEFSGNFERAWCAFAAGVYDKFSRYSEAIPAFKEAAEGAKRDIDLDVFDWIYAHVIGEPPVSSIRPTPGWFNNGLGGHFRDGMEEEAFKHYQKAAQRHYKIASTVSPYGCGDAKQTIAPYLSTMVHETELTKYPAYLSVQMEFCEPLPKNVVATLQERTTAFFEYKYKYNKVDVVDMYVVHMTVQQTRL